VFIHKQLSNVVIILSPLYITPRLQSGIRGYYDIVVSIGMLRNIKTALISYLFSLGYYIYYNVVVVVILKISIDDKIYITFWSII